MQWIARRQGRPLGGELGRRVVEPGEEFVGGEVERGQRADDRAQLAHGGRRIEAPPGHAAHDQGATGAGQRDGVVPRPGIGAGDGQEGGLQGRVRLGLPGQQLALHRGCHGVLTGETPGVVHAQGRVGGQLDGQLEVSLVEGRGVARAVEADEPHDRVAQGERRGEQGVGVCVADGVRARRIHVEPGGVRLQVHDPRAQVGHGLGEGRRRRQPAHVTHRVRPRRLPTHAAERGAHERGVRGQRGERRVVAAEDAVHHFDDGDVGERGDHGRDEFLAGDRRVQRTPHRAPYRVEDPHTAPVALALGDIDAGDSDAQRLAARVLQPQRRDLDVTQIVHITLRVDPQDVIAQGHAGGQHLTQGGLDVLPDDVVHVPDRPSDHLVRGDAPHGGRGDVGPDHVQFRVEQMQADR
ncbi:hypothetical protein GCM10010121_003200 [Streptomyces brasiliensis]|uniref:Uncharacterized protein n=1 Tax=Streptomyces brasiliensis TaxID=1954 RepID=A0A917K0N1_9ACTN|nr:hypothetical protein GCM10010121_003200 [Streptomyces brasiliensis]